MRHSFLFIFVTILKKMYRKMHKIRLINRYICILRVLSEILKDFSENYIKRLKILRFLRTSSQICIFTFLLFANTFDTYFKIRDFNFSSFPFLLHLFMSLLIYLCIHSEQKSDLLKNKISLSNENCSKQVT